MALFRTVDLKQLPTLQKKKKVNHGCFTTMFYLNAKWCAGHGNEDRFFFALFFTLLFQPVLKLSPVSPTTLNCKYLPSPGNQPCTTSIHIRYVWRRHSRHSCWNRHGIEASSKTRKEISSLRWSEEYAGFLILNNWMCAVDHLIVGNCHSI